MTNSIFVHILVISLGTSLFICAADPDQIRFFDVGSNKFEAGDTIRPYRDHFRSSTDKPDYHSVVLAPLVGNHKLELIKPPRVSFVIQIESNRKNRFLIRISSRIINQVIRFEHVGFISNDSCSHKEVSDILNSGPMYYISEAYYGGMEINTMIYEKKADSSKLPDEVELEFEGSKEGIISFKKALVDIFKHADDFYCIQYSSEQHPQALRDFHHMLGIPEENSTEPEHSKSSSFRKLAASAKKAFKKTKKERATPEQVLEQSINQKADNIYECSRNYLSAFESSGTKGIPHTYVAKRYPSPIACCPSNFFETIENEAYALICPELGVLEKKYTVKVLVSHTADKKIRIRLEIYPNERGQCCQRIESDITWLSAEGISDTIEDAVTKAYSLILSKLKTTPTEAAPLPSTTTL